MVLYLRFSGSLSTCFQPFSRPHAQPRWSPWKNASLVFQTHSPTTTKWCKAPLIFKTMDGLVPGHYKWPKTYCKRIMVATGSPSVAQVWSLWLALMRFTWERRGFPPFLLEVFNNYIYYTIYIYIYVYIYNQGCKRNSPIHCAMVRFLTVIQRECFALLTIPHAIFSQHPCTQAGPLQYIRYQPLFVGILWILSPPLTQPLTPSERMMIDASGRFAIWKSTARMPKHWKNPIKSVRPNSFMHEWQRAKQARNLNMKLDSVHPTN